MWRNHNSCHLLAKKKKENSAVAVENVTAIPPKYKNTVNHMIQQFYFLIFKSSKELKAQSQKEICTSTFTVATLIVTKRQNNPNVH